MRFDAKCEVICDECGAVEWWEPEYIFTDYSGEHGHYDTSETAYAKWIKSVGWSGDGDDDRCDSCLAQERE